MMLTAFSTEAYNYYFLDLKYNLPEVKNANSMLENNS